MKKLLIAIPEVVALIGLCTLSFSNAVWLCTLLALAHAVVGVGASWLALGHDRSTGLAVAETCKGLGMAVVCSGSAVAGMLLAFAGVAYSSREKVVL